MFRKAIQCIYVSILVLSLSACGKSVDQQIENGLNLTAMIFSEVPREVTDKVGNFQFYLPSDFKIEKSEDDVNILLSKGDSSYILFVNEQEETNSKLHYDILKNDCLKKIIKEKTFEKDGIFGFSAVAENGDNMYEIIVSLGGIKMTTISSEQNIEENIKDMLKIVRSIKG